MPEIPEIETYVYHLNRLAAGKTISQAEVTRPKTINLLPEEFAAEVIGSRLTQARRRAKVLVLNLDRGTSLLCHLMLDGYVVWLFPGETPRTTPQVLLTFGAGEALGFCRFQLGYVHLALGHDPAAMPDLQDIGPEPLGPDFTAERLASILKGRRTVLKTLLLDQHLIAGIGGSYSDEILFAAGLRPDRPAGGLDPGETGRLYQAIEGVLQRAIALGGAMDQPFFTGDTFSNRQYPRYAVYGREGQPCLRCGATLQMTVLGGRKSRFCPVCQDLRPAAGLLPESVWFGKESGLPAAKPPPGGSNFDDGKHAARPDGYSGLGGA
ncbi:MAG: Fpg/Nei family DNA glycosylase [Symbiobacteriia bacterium]